MTKELAELDDDGADLEPDLDEAPADVDDEAPPIPDDLVFTTDEKPPEREELWFSAVGYRLRALNPTKFAWSLLLAGFANVATEADRVNATLQFAQAALDERSWMIVYKLGISGEMPSDMLGEIMSALILRWAPPEARKQAERAAQIVKQPVDAEKQTTHAAQNRGNGNRAQRRAKHKP